MTFFEREGFADQCCPGFVNISLASQLKGNKEKLGAKSSTKNTTERKQTAHKAFKCIRWQLFKEIKTSLKWLLFLCCHKNSIS